MGEEHLEAWQFKLVAPEAPGGFITFCFALREEISEAIRCSDEEVWGILLEQVDETKKKKIREFH